MLQPRPANLRSARVVSVVEVTTYEGSGTSEDIGREVVRYYSPDGELLAERDPAAVRRVTLDGSGSMSFPQQVGIKVQAG